MRLVKAGFLILVACTATFAGSAGKQAEKQAQAKAKVMVKDAKSLEKAGRLVEARKEYMQSEAVFETKDAVKGIKRVDDKLQEQVKNTIAAAQKLYAGGQFRAAADQLEHALTLETYTALVQRDLALCYYRLNDSAKAVDLLDQAAMATPDPKQRAKLLPLRTVFVTREDAPSLDKATRQRVIEFNQAATNLGFSATLDDPSADPAQPGAEPATGNDPVVTSRVAKIRPCLALESVKSSLDRSASSLFNLANCAETNARHEEAARFLQRYLELAPKALDGDEVRTRLGELQSLLSLSGPNADQVRKLFSSASRSIEERKYDRALDDLLKAENLAPDFALTQWRLGLFYEALGNVDEARTRFTRYQQLSPGDNTQHPADLHLQTLDARHAKYVEETDKARNLLAELLNLGLNLDFDQPKDKHWRPERAHVQKTRNEKKAEKEVGGFAVPYGYAQDQMAQAAEHLQRALSLFPLGAEANEMMAFIYLQANDGQSAIRCFDAVAGQHLPVAFYAECRGHKQDHAVRCELSQSGIRLIFLSSYNKRGQPSRPEVPAGRDGLGDLAVSPSFQRQDKFDALTLAQLDIKGVETKNGMVRLKLAERELSLSPVFLAALTPVEGPQARRFANSYTRLFARYPGLEESKLGKEGLTGMEKVRLGYEIASASANVAMTALFPAAAAFVAMEDAQTVFTLTRQVSGVMDSLHVSFGSWEKIVGEQQRMLVGDPFKTIPVDPPDLSFVSEIKS